MEKLSKETRNLLLKVKTDLEAKNLCKEAVAIVDEVIQEDGNLHALVNELNKDLELEYAAMIQYIQHAAAMKEAQFDNIRKELLVHAEEEHDHAVEVSDKINYLGGVPSVNVEKINAAKSSVEMLMQDAEGEKTAIERYKVRIEQARNLGEYGVEEMLRKILTEEEEHLNDLMTSLSVERDDVQEVQVEKLVGLADKLDEKGLIEEATIVDNLIKKVSE